MLLARLARQVIREGRLTLIDARGRTHVVKGEREGPEAGLRFHTAKAERRVAFNPQLALGECYMDGSVEPEGCDIIDVLRLLISNMKHLDGSVLHDLANRWRFVTRRIAQHNPIGKARDNVAHHYDLSSELYQRFLDRDRFYSCAYFPEGVDTLEEAQAAKARHLAAKLRLEPNARILDIGCGWGSLAMHLVRLGAQRVDGVTLSQEQHAWASEWARREKLDRQARFHLRDYRDVEEQYDRIVSVGMFEHVGVGHYEEYFAKVARLLREDGVAVIHSIGRSSPPGFTNPWLAKYIFPGGYVPALSEVLPVIEKAGLIVTDLEVLRVHYAETLRHWRERFLAHWDEVAELYDERFCRMWNFYLAGSETSFREGDMMVFQVQLAKTHAAVPLTRDYIHNFENAHPLDQTMSKARVEQPAE